jgi:DNA polymerase III delta prime subunit
MNINNYETKNNMNLNLNTFLNREEECNKIEIFLREFELNKKNLLIKRGLYLYGNSGTGKTSFVVNLLSELGYDVVKYDAGDIRNKSVIETITTHNMSNRNIMSMLHNKIKKIVIVMDEIDGMNNGDKGGINSLIKIIRPKKTKRQKTEEITSNPIICIGNYYIDKKIKELMKVCNVIELKTPTIHQITNILNYSIPSLPSLLLNDVIQFIQGDLRKMFIVIDLYKNNPSLIVNINNTFCKKYYNDDTKQITKKLLNNNYSLNDHHMMMNETDRTIVGLLWHENIIEVIGKMKKSISIPFYIKVLNNTCLSDYIDRITFQKQIWQFNEMTSLIKTFKNNKIYHESFKRTYKYNPSEVRFTKVLTKYSTEFNNTTFIQHLCQQLGMDKKDMLSFFLNLKNNYSDNELFSLFENYEISKLDINRIYRYINKYTCENSDTNDDEQEIDEDLEFN